MAECNGAEAAALQESVDLSGWIFPMECQIQEELKIITWLHLSKAAGYFSTQGNGTLGDPRLLEETQRSICKEHDLAGGRWVLFQAMRSHVLFVQHLNMFADFALHCAWSGRFSSARGEICRKPQIKHRKSVCHKEGHLSPSSHGVSV